MQRQRTNGRGELGTVGDSKPILSLHLKPGDACQGHALCRGEFSSLKADSAVITLGQDKPEVGKRC